MNAELKTKWLDALRGGLFAQGTEFMRRGDWYCGLGVLCAISEQCKFTVSQQSSRRFEGVYEVDALDGSSASGLVTEWIGDEAYQAIARMNDNGKSFAEIADWIEANVPVDAN